MVSLRSYRASTAVNAMLAASCSLPLFDPGLFKHVERGCRRKLHQQLLEALC